MARLPRMAPRLTAARPALAWRPEAERARLQVREATTDYRKWYKTARWDVLRKHVLLRDNYTCQQTGALLSGQHPAPDSPVVDHIKPHNGDPDLFWDMGNLQSVTKAWHDSAKQSAERMDKQAAIHPKWLKPSIIPLTIICGPPASGKTTYAMQHASKTDVIIDLDRIASDLSGEPLHGWPERWLHPALFRRNDMLGSLSRPSDHDAAWFIVSEPKARHRDWWHEMLKPQRIIVMEVPEPECMRRAATDPDRDQGKTRQIIETWWRDYERRIGDVRLSD